MASPQSLPTHPPLPEGETQVVADACVVFKLDELEFAVALAVVERIVQAVEITPLPEAPHGVRGMIDLQGRVVPVFDLRARLGLPPREPRVTDLLVICHTHWRTVALLVDAAAGVVSRSEAQITPVADILPEMESVTGVMMLDGNMVLVHDLERFLAIEDHAALPSLLPL